jgi:hypothetical protein
MGTIDERWDSLIARAMHPSVLARADRVQALETHLAHHLVPARRAVRDGDKAAVLEHEEAIVRLILDVSHEDLIDLSLVLANKLAGAVEHAEVAHGCSAECDV